MITGSEKIGVKIPTILLPKKDIDLKKWSVIACDQYTSQPEYWAEVEKFVGGGVSTLHLIFPEVFLGENRKDKEKRIERINETMKNYLDQGILVSHGPGFVYVERKTSTARSRKGLIMAIDLEKYDPNRSSQSLIRSTEKTVSERIPPRLKIRESAPLELSHVILLIDDPEKKVFEPIEKKIAELEKLYDFDLMIGGGHLEGYKINDEGMISNILKALESLADPSVFYKKYGVSKEKNVLLFAVGDGNHSLAAAKAHWEKIKKTSPADMTIIHPARYVLAEAVNLHNEGLKFEPIHRVVFHVDPKQLLKEMVNFYSKNGLKASYRFFAPQDKIDREIKRAKENKNSHILPFITKEKFGMAVIENPKFNLEVGTLQSFLDEFIKDHQSAVIDYIHGEGTVKSLAARDGNIGFYLPPMDKDKLFKTVIVEGALPKKTFSLGEAEDKRFYLECRKIVKDQFLL